MSLTRFRAAVALEMSTNLCGTLFDGVLCAAVVPRVFHVCVLCYLLVQTVSILVRPGAHEMRCMLAVCTVSAPPSSTILLSNFVALAVCPARPLCVHNCKWPHVWNLSDLFGYDQLYHFSCSHACRKDDISSKRCPWPCSLGYRFFFRTQRKLAMSPPTATKNPVWELKCRTIILVENYAQ